MTGIPNGSKAPWWVHAIAVVGLPGALALLLIGERLNLLPGVQSAADKANRRLEQLERIQRENGAVIRWTCHAIWVHTGDEKMAKLCYQKWSDDDRSGTD